MASSSGTNVFLIPTVHYTTCSVADLFWPGRPRAPKCSHITGSPQMQLEIPRTPNHLSHCCPQGQSSCRHSSGAAGQALSGVVSLGQFLTSGAKLYFSLLGLVSQRETEANPCFFSSLSCFQELWSCSPSGVGGLGGDTGPAGSRLEPFSSTGSLLLAGSAGGNWRPSLKCCC